MVSDIPSFQACYVVSGNLFGEALGIGTHPSLLHLHQILSDRRENLLRLSELRLKQKELEMTRVRDWDKYAVLSWWQVREIP